jgi:hypothetical protein
MEATLPPQFRDMVHGTDKSKDGKNFDDFPWLKTFGQNKTHVIQLTAPQVNLPVESHGVDRVGRGARIRDTLLKEAR